MQLIRGTSVEVTRRVPSGTDRFGAETYETQTETVDNVLPQPGSTSSSTGSTDDLGEERPNGVSVDMAFHFPKGYGRSLRGCVISYDGRDYRVIGDPQPLVEANTPGPWNLTVGTEAVDG